MTLGIDLAMLSHLEKDHLILSLIDQLDTALARIAELEKRLAAYERPPKNPGNSSLPPSRGQKPDRSPGDKPPRRGRRGFGRLLEPNPDRVVDATLSACPHCTAAFALEQQTPQQVYDRIELPPIKPDVTRVRLFGGRCACCGERATARVFVAHLAVLHVIRPSRGKAVVHEVFGPARPQVWVSDMLGSQRGHAKEWQVCLAHLLRDVRYAVECGDTAFSTLFGQLLLRAIAIGRRRNALKDTTLAQYRADLDRRLDRVLAAVPIGEPGRRLRRRIAANRAHLFVFVTDRRVPATNNVSERHLRPSVIFRKVTNGFRCEWGAETYAAFRSVVSTAKSNRAAVLDVLRFVMAQPSAKMISARVG